MQVLGREKEGMPAEVMAVLDATVEVGVIHPFRRRVWHQWHQRLDKSDATLPSSLNPFMFAVPSASPLCLFPDVATIPQIHTARHCIESLISQCAKLGITDLCRKIYIGNMINDPGNEASVDPSSCSKGRKGFTPEHPIVGWPHEPAGTVMRPEKPTHMPPF